jgi:hypothetical protein
LIATTVHPDAGNSLHYGRSGGGPLLFPLRADRKYLVAFGGVRGDDQRLRHNDGEGAVALVEYAIAAGVGVIELSIMFSVMMRVVPRTVDREIALALSANGGTLGSDASSHWRVV